MIKSLTKFVDERGTICIAQVGIEIPYAINSIEYEKDAIFDLSNYKTFTLIVIKGNLLVDTGQEKIELCTDHCYTFHADKMVIIDDISNSCLYLIISHDGVKVSEQPNKIYQEQSTFQNCLLHSNSMNEINYKPCIEHAQRIFYLKDIKEGKSRGGHAHRYCKQGIMALDGSYKISLEDGENKKSIMLESANDILNIPPYIFASESEFSEDAVCLVIASHDYDRSGYIDSIEELRKIKSEIYR